MYLNKQAPLFLVDVFESAMAHETLDISTREWLIRGILAYVRGESKSLDAALGLSTAGKRNIRTIILLNTRNRYLLESLDSIAIDDSVSTWERCQRLAQQVGRLIPVWNARRGYRHGPDASFSTWQRSLFKAWQTGIDIPGTPEGLLRITKTNPRYSISSDDFTIISPYI